MTRFIVAAIVTAIVIFILRAPLSRLWQGDDSSSAAEPGARLREGGGTNVEARPSDPAGSSRELVSPGAPLDELRSLALQPVPVQGLTKVGGQSWVDTRVVLEDARQFDLIERCHAESSTAAPVDECSFRLTRVVSPAGEVEYVRASTLPGQSLEGRCAAVATCIAQSKLGERVPLPATFGDYLAVEQQIHASPLPEKFSDPAYIDEMVATLEGDLEAAQREVDKSRAEDGDYVFQYVFEEAMAEYLRERAERLRGGEGTAP